MNQFPWIPELSKPLPGLGEPEGLLSWIGSIDHKQIGIMYLLTTLVFFLVVTDSGRNLIIEIKA